MFRVRRQCCEVGREKENKKKDEKEKRKQEKTLKDVFLLFHLIADFIELDRLTARKERNKKREKKVGTQLL